MSKGKSHKRIIFLVGILGAIGAFAASSMFSSPNRTNLSNSDIAILFVGNSFTSCNALDKMVESLVREVTGGSSVYTIRSAPGGYRMHQHASSLRRGRLATHFTKQNRGHWDFVVLQGQSQVPGFAPENPQTSKVVDGFRAFAQKTADLPCRVCLLMTWGYLNTDNFNPKHYPNYETMQARLAAGYHYIRKVMLEDNPKVEVSPVGLAFQRVRQKDPRLFKTLFARDGKHPSAAGTYLAASVLTAHITGKSVVKANWVPNRVSTEDARLLRKCAQEATEQYSPLPTPRGFKLKTSTRNNFGFRALEPVVVELVRGEVNTQSSRSAKQANFKLFGGRLVDDRSRDWGIGIEFGEEPNYFRSGDAIFILFENETFCRLRFFPESYINQRRKSFHSK